MYLKGVNTVLKLLFFLLPLSILCADATVKEIKIHDSIAKSIFSKGEVKTYIPSSDLHSKISEYSKVMEPSPLLDASYIILSDALDINTENAVLFVTDYKLLKKYKNAVGAFYWKKGRPTIIFIRERVERKNISLPSSLEKYLENEKCLYELCF